MMKRFTAIIIAVIIVFASSATGAAILITEAVIKNRSESTLKAEREKTYITDVFHDQGSVYMEPTEPEKGETVTLRLRTLRYNVTKAQIQYTEDKGVSWKTADMKYKGGDKTGYFDIWEGSFKAEGNLIYYRFTASNNDSFNTVYYDKKKTDITEGEYSNGWQIVPGYKTPDWAKGALWYSAMPDSFYNGNTLNDKQTSGNNTYTAWNKLRRGLNDKYGGDLSGIEAKIDYIKSLGADAVYINPIQKSYQNAGYGPVRYDEVESSFGNEQDLKSFSDAIHNSGLRLMGDVILTFTDADSIYFNKSENWPLDGAYQSKNSQWYDLFKFFKWPDNYMIGWLSPSINLNTDTAKKLFYSENSSYLVKYSELFDGYRFDCGGWLWGTSETDNVKTVEFVKQIRNALKSKNSDFFMLAEADWGNMNTASWDAAWNIQYMPKLQDYAKGLINETLMLEAMYDYEMTIPRNVALCLENMISDHDSYRVSQDDDAMYNAAVLVQMTYLGAPCIYYGEEINGINDNGDGIGSNTSFYSMNWDESEWDWERLAFYKATAELRKKYSCIKTGAVKILGSDIAENILTFGRWDEKGAAITVASQNSEVKQVEIKAYECDIKNGTVLTDWYTGKEYVVKDGKITVDIIPGGTVLVTGKKSSGYRGTFENYNIGGASGKVTMRDTAAFTVDSKGKISGKKDKLLYSAAPVWNDFSFYAGMSGNNNAALMIRENTNRDSSFYSAEVKGNKIHITARKKSGEKPVELAEIKIEKNTYVKLSRGADNLFRVYTAEVSDGTLGEFKAVKSSDVYIPMSEKVYYGFAGLKGEMKINNITFEQGNKRILFDNFDGKTPVSMFGEITGKNVSVKDGQLTVASDKGNIAYLLTTPPVNGDWSFKSLIDYTAAKDEYAGIVSKQDDNNFIIAGRKQLNGKNVIFIGKYANGELDVYDYVNDTADGKKIIVQLQRTGAYYSAVYSADNGKTWNWIGRLYTNYSDEHIGLAIKGKTKLVCDWVSFGDSINDSSSYSTPHSPVSISTEYNNVETEDEAKYEFVSGNWEMVTGGWQQLNSSGTAIAAAANKEYSALYAEATLKNCGKGFMGIAFGGDTARNIDGGWQLRYYGDKLAVYKDGKELASEKVSAEKDGTLRTVLRAENGKIKVYAGQDPKIVISLENTGYKQGYIEFYTNGTKGEFTNFYIGHTSANWVITSGECSGNTDTVITKNVVQDGRQIHSAATLAGYGFSNAVFKLRIMNTPVKSDAASVSGILLSASEGNSASKDGILIGINGDNELILSAAGNVKERYAIPKSRRSAQVCVVKRGGEYKVYCEFSKEPVITYTEKINRGGVFTLYSYNAVGAFDDISIKNLQTDENYEVSVGTGNASFSDNLNSSASVTNYLFYEKDYADYSVKNGTLVCENSSDWIAGATIIERPYSDFDMSFKLKINSSKSGWMSVGIRKGNPIGNHNDSGFSLMISQSGQIFFFESSEQKEFSRTTYDGFDGSEWNDVRISASGENVIVYINDRKVCEYRDTKYCEGFISFTSGMTDFEIDDIAISAKG